MTEPLPPHGSGDATAATSPDHEQACEYLAQLLQACGIFRVINVDDGNRGSQESEIDPDFIVATMISGKLTVDTLMSSDSTRRIVGSVDGQPPDQDDIIADLRLQPPSYTEAELKELTNAARLASKTGDATAGEDGNRGNVSDEAKASTDKPTLTVDIEALGTLEKLFAKVVQFSPLTFAQWREQKDGILANDSPVLILFDRDFRLEGERDNAGDELIAEVLRNGQQSVYCGMLTHSATSDDAELRTIREITQSFDLDAAQLIVMAKEQVRHAPMKLVSKVKTAVLIRDLITLRTTTAKALTESAVHASAELARLDAYTLHALVDAAAHEGNHEFGNLVRVAATYSRRNLVRRLHTDGLLASAAERLRFVRIANPPGHGLRQPDGLDARRQLDSFDDADYLAEHNLPIEPGDIFQVVDAQQLLVGTITPRQPRFILLTQPCDTMIRPDGSRMADPGMLIVAPLKWIADCDERRVRSSDFRLSWFEPDRHGGDWYVRVAETTQVPTIGLDACVLSADGTGRIVVDSTAPNTLTPGWAKRHGKLQEWAKKKLERLRSFEAKQPLAPEMRLALIESLTGSAKDLHAIKAGMDLITSTVAFGVRRISRLTDPRTRMLLTLTSQHLGRPADDGPLLADLSEDPL